MGPVEIKGVVLVGALGVGALCLWIGYRLYLHGVIEKGKISASGGGVKVEAADYGPGVAFAVLGAFIVLFAITRGLETTRTTTVTTTTAAPEGPTAGEAVRVEQTTEAWSAAEAQPEDEAE